MSDPLMQYLLHAIPPTGRWYALWHEESAGPDSDHEIIRVSFSTAQDGDRYGDLTEGMKRWRWYASASTADHERELRSLVEAGPPSSPVDGDYVRARLETDEGRTTFWRNAEEDEWFHWVAEEGFLNALSDPEHPTSQATLWGRWCLSHFAAGGTPLILSFLKGRAVALNPGFRNELLVHLLQSELLPPGPVLRQFLALVLNSTEDTLIRGHELQWLLQRLYGSGRDSEMVAVMRGATRLRLQPLERLYLSLEEDEADELQPLAIRVRCATDPTALVDFLHEHGAVVAETVGEDLLSIGVQRIVEAYELLELARGRSSESDWLSFGRTAVAESDQDTMSQAVDALVVLVRTVLDAWREDHPAALSAFAGRFDTSEKKLLQRLALYAHAQTLDESSDDLLKRAVDQGWPRDPWVRPEFYLLLGTHYGSATEDGRKTFLERIQDDYRAPDFVGQ